MDQTDTKRGNSARTLAIIAIIVALTAPFWEGALLSSINIHMPLTREVAQNGLALDRLDRRTAELEQQLAGTTAQLGKLQSQLADTTARATAAADRTSTLAMVELVTALRRSGGFELELAMLRGTLANAAEMQPLLDQIEPYAVTGVPSAGRIRQEFTRISARIQGGGPSVLSVSWMTRLLPWQRSANAAPTPPDPTPGLLSQASTQLGGGDMAGAVATLQTVGGQAQEALADWLEDAKARVAADAVMQRLNEQIMQRASQGAPAAPRKT